MAFDPDAYLAKKQSEFDPDAYLASMETAQPVQTQAQIDRPGVIDRALRSAGITARGGLSGLAALPLAVTDVAAYPVNLISRMMGKGNVLPNYTQQFQQGLTELGLPVPQGSIENLQSVASMGIGGAGGGIGLGQQLAQSARPAVAGIGNVLQSARASQAVAGGTAGLSSELARQQGVGPIGQFLAGIGGGLGGGMAAQRMLPQSWNLPPASIPKMGTLKRTPEVEEKSVFGNTKPLFDNETASNADRTSQYKKSVEILDKAGVQLSKGQRSGTGSVRAVETTLETLPVVGKPLQNLADKTRIQYQKQLLKMAGNEAGDTMINEESLNRTKEALSARYAEALKDKAVSIDDDAFLNNLADIEAKHTDLVDAGTASKVKDIVNQFLAKASKEGAFTGEKYQKQRSIFAERAKGQTELSGLYRDLKDALDDAFHRASGDKGKLDAQYAQYKQLENIYNRTGGPMMSEGFISPVQVARQASNNPGTQEWRDFARAAATVLPDRLPNTGSGQRAMISRMAMGDAGKLFAGGALFGYEPMMTGFSMLGARGVAGNLAAQPSVSQFQINPLLMPSVNPLLMGNK